MFTVLFIAFTFADFGDFLLKVHFNVVLFKFVLRKKLIRWQFIFKRSLSVNIT